MAWLILLHMSTFLAGVTLEQDLLDSCSKLLQSNIKMDEKKSKSHERDETQVYF